MSNSGKAKLIRGSKFYFLLEFLRRIAGKEKKENVRLVVLVGNVDFFVLAFRFFGVGNKVLEAVRVGKGPALGSMNKI